MPRYYEEDPLGEAIGAGVNRGVELAILNKQKKSDKDEEDRRRREEFIQEQAFKGIHPHEAGKSYKKGTKYYTYGGETYAQEPDVMSESEQKTYDADLAYKKSQTDKNVKSTKIEEMSISELTDITTKMEKSVEGRVDRMSPKQKLVYDRLMDEYMSRMGVEMPEEEIDLDAPGTPKASIMSAEAGAAAGRAGPGPAAFNPVTRDESIELPPEITTTSEAIDHLVGLGMSRGEAIDWLKNRGS